MNSHPASAGQRMYRWLAANHNELSLALWSGASFYITATPLVHYSVMFFVPLALGAVYYPVVLRKKPVIARVNPWMGVGALVISFAILASYFFNVELYDEVFICGNLMSDALLFLTLYTLTWKMEIDFRKLVVYTCIFLLPGFLLILHDSVVVWGRVMPADDLVAANYVAMIGLVCFIGACSVRSLLGFVILAALPVYVIVVMQSRDSELGCCIVAAIIFGFRLSKVDWRKQQVSLALFFVLAPLVYLGLNFFAGIDLFSEAADVFDRVTMVNDQFRGVDSGGSGRTDIWKAALQRIGESPVFGHGFKGQDRVLPDNLVAHNAYLGILVETGVVGLLSYLIMVYTGFYHLVKRGRSLDAFPQRLAVYVSFLVYGLVESRAFGFGNTYTLFFLMIAFDSSKRPVVARPTLERTASASRPAGLSPATAHGALTAR